MEAIPERLRWVFWNLDFGALDVERDAVTVLARVLEYGDMESVRWALRRYGPERIHDFFRTSGHPEVSARTRAFWRAWFRAEDERWLEPPAWRRSSGAPWID